jgi:hypothetical protein
MAPAAEKVLAEALRLTPEDRAEVASQLLRSLDEEDDQELPPEDRARLHEAIARSEEQFGQGLAIPADGVLERLGKP